jgi:tripartite ATP-independent transporter DctP family solute receptor
MRRSAFVAGAGTAAAAATLPRRTRAAQFQFKCGGLFPVEHPMSVRDKQMWEAIERESGGRIQAQFFPGNQLGSDVAQFTQMRAGVIQFYHCPPSVAGGLIPALNLTDVAFAFKDIESAIRSTQGPFGEYIRAECETKGIHTMRTVWDSGMRELINSRRPIRIAKDLDGLKIRTTQSKFTIEFFKALGANPTPLAFAELYTGLQTKLLDGAELPLVTVQTGRFYEVQKYLSLTDNSWSCLWWMANGEVWKSLPPDLQQIIERNNTKYAAIERVDVKNLLSALIDKLGREGMAVNRGNAADFRDHLRGYYAFCKESFDPKAWALLEAATGIKV